MPIYSDRIEQDEPLEAPNFAPVNPMPMPQILPQQGYSPYINGPGAYQMPDSPSVLNTPEITQALRTQAMQQIQNLGAASSGKGDRIRSIFTGVMAPAMAIFGGPGGAAAGAELVRNARQQAMVGRQQKLSEQQAAASALKSIVDIENIIRLKPIGAMMRNQTQQQSNAIRQGELERKTQQGNRSLGIRETRNRIMDDNYKRIGTLKERGLQIQENKLTQARQLAEMRDQTLREIAVLNNQNKRGIANQTDETRRAQLTQRFQEIQAKLATSTEQHNQSIRSSIEQHNNAVRQKGGGELLNADQFMLNFDGLDYQQPQDEPDDDDYAAALQAVMSPQRQAQPQAQPAPQAPAATPQPAPQQKAVAFNGRPVAPKTQQNLLMLLQQRNGMNLQQATEFLRSKGLM